MLIWSVVVASVWRRETAWGEDVIERCSEGALGPAIGVTAERVWSGVVVGMGDEKKSRGKVVLVAMVVG